MALFVALAAPLSGCAGLGAPAERPTVAPSDDTTLGPGDVFDVRVFGEEDLTGRYRVSQDGTIDFPLLGRVAVDGREPTEVVDALASAVREAYPRLSHRYYAMKAKWLGM